jgi:hypothetical protein
MVSSAQVVFRVDAGKEFIPGITSLVEGLIWADNAYVEQPSGAAGYTFVCVSLVNGPTDKIAISAGQEVPLFSFVNSGNGCAGKVEILANEDLMVQAVRSAGFNVTQHFAVLGARGNAFSGLVNGEVDCTPATGISEPVEKSIEEVSIAPVPADKVVTIQWNVLAEQPGLRQMVICDSRGSEVMREKISDSKGHHTLNVNVENWQAGMYRVRFVFENSQQTQSWNLMVIH